MCALSARDSDGLTAAFDSDTPLSCPGKSFKQLLTLRLAQNGNGKPPQPAAAMVSPASAMAAEVK